MRFFWQKRPDETDTLYLMRMDGYVTQIVTQILRPCIIYIC